MKRISLTFAGVFFMASLCAAQQFLSADLSNFRQEGIASWYGAEFNGRPTASGEIFDSSLYTAAHPTLPFGVLLTVTNLNNGRRVNVRVNDRGPFVSSRIIDLSQAAAQMLDMVREGTAPVLVEALNGSVQAGNSGYQAGTDSYARSEGGLSSASSQIITPPYPVYQAVPQDPVIIHVQPSPQETVQAPPQQQIPQYFQQPVQPQAPQQPWYSQQQPQQTRQPPMQPVRPQANPPQTQGPAPQTVQPLQIHIPIEVRPVVTAETTAPSVPAAAPAAPAPVVTTVPAASPPAAPVVTTVPATPPPSPVPQIQVTVKSGAIYRVQIGSYKEARNALAAFELLKAAGLNPLYERHGDFFRVVLSGIPSAEMAAVLRKVQTAGFNEPLLREEL